MYQIESFFNQKKNLALGSNRECEKTQFLANFR